jgi:multidrug efflux system membrane fusion protein
VSFAGEITPRRENAIAFRIAGKLSERLVDVGDQVRKGQPIARLDATDYRLARQNFQAQLTAAKADRDFARADLARYHELLEQKVIAVPEFDRHHTAFTAANERVASLEAQLAQTSNQLGYTELYAERDGVITAFIVEAGDVLATGQPVARLAQLDEMEVTVDVPEQRIDEIQSGQSAQATLWAHGDKRFRVKIREIAPLADPKTRTYRVKASLVEGREVTRLGMTATLLLPTRAVMAVSIPRSAVFTSHNESQQPKVWRVDALTGTVSSVPVTLRRSLSGERIEVEGLSLGETIVEVGVQRLIEGQAVRILADATGNGGLL